MADNGDDPFQDTNYLHLLSMGYIGNIATNFVDYVKKNYKVYTPEDILNKFPKDMEDEFSKMIVTDVTFYSKELVDYIKKSGKVLTKKQNENLFKFYKVIPKEAASGFWSAFRTECNDASAAWYNMEVVVGTKKTYPVREYTFGFLKKTV
jgi:hypothetical protein